MSASHGHSSMGGIEYNEGVMWRRHVTSQICNLDCYTLDHHCISYFIAFGPDPEILRNSRTHGESWGFRYFSYLGFLKF